MFERIFKTSKTGLVRIRSLRKNSSGEQLEGFSGELLRTRYSLGIVRKHIRAAEHLVHWAARKHIPASGLNEHSLERFRQHLSRRRCAHSHTDRGKQLVGARLFLKYLREIGVITAPRIDAVVEPALLVAFREWMREQRGTSDSTLEYYNAPVHAWLKRHGEDPTKINAHGVRQFLLEYSGRHGHASVQHYATALRMFLRFLCAQGKCRAELEAAVPVISNWRLSSLPRYFSAADVQRIIAACDSTTPLGRRNRAILLLLARLGLRAEDIVKLRLQDIDWRNAWIEVCGKGRRQTRLPLTQEVGNALMAYLKNGRPQTDSDHVFVRNRAPFVPLNCGSAVSTIVAHALHRAGVTRPSRGAAHLLRHSVATSLLRHGSSLQDIATVLRHRSIRTTQIYTKVDVNALRRIAQPWPEVRSC